MIDYRGDALAMLTWCPRCIKGPGEPCVYMSPPRGKRSGTYDVMRLRAGKPTQRPHNARRRRGIEEYWQLRYWLMENAGIFRLA